MFGLDQSALMVCDHKFTHVGRFKSSGPYNTFGPVDLHFGQLRMTKVYLVIKYQINLSSRKS